GGERRAAAAERFGALADGKVALTRAVRVRQDERVLIDAEAHESELLTVGRDCNRGDKARRQSFRRAAEDGYLVEHADGAKPVRPDVVDVVAFRRERHPAVLTFSGRDDLHVTVRGD